MDQIPPLVTTGVPSLGVLGLLAWLVIKVMRQSSADRNSYDQQLSAITDRYDKAIEDLRGQLSDLRGELREVRRELEEERSRRHAAEDEAAALRRRLAGETAS